MTDDNTDHESRRTTTTVREVPAERKSGIFPDDPPPILRLWLGVGIFVFAGAVIPHMIWWSTTPGAVETHSLHGPTAVVWSYYVAVAWGISFVVLLASLFGGALVTSALREWRDD